MGSLFGLRKLSRLVVFTYACFFILEVHASSYHDWLVSQQGSDGSILSSASLSNPIQSTHEALKALSFDQINAQPQSALAQTYLAASDVTNIELLSRVIAAQSLNGSVNGALVSMLLQHQNRDGGFGAYAGYESDPLTTTYALNALAVSSGASTQIAKAVGYLLSQRQPDGGWKLDGNSSIALTAEVIVALASQTKYSGVSAALAGARAYLINNKKNDNTWGQTFESALALSALATGANSSSEFAASVEAISNRASTNNWHGDVYTTALVLQAFKRVNSLGNSASGKGAIKGQVFIVGSTRPVTGASVSIANTSLQVFTDAQGQFNVANVPEGSQTIVISKAGFSSTSAVAIVKNALVTDAGQLVLGQSAAGGIVTGKIFNSGSLVAISDATIELKGSKSAIATANSSGVFEMVGLPDGNYSFTIDAAGYHKISGSFSLTSGTNIQINQGLVSLDAPLVNDPIALFGKVIDGSTGLPVTNARLVINGSNINTNNSGEFTTQPLNRGNHPIQISAANYVNANYSINFPAGAAGNLGNLAIYKATATELPTAVDLLATAVNSVSGAPITGALIKVQGRAITAITDVNGNASLRNIEHLSFSVEVSAAGYNSQQFTISASSFGAVTGTFSLVPETPESSSWSLTGVVQDEITQAPIAGAQLSFNSGAITVVTGANGQYQINGLSAAEIVVDITADNYLAIKKALKLGAVKGTYVVDFTLPVRDDSVPLHLLSIESPTVVLPDSRVILNLNIENHSAQPEQAMVLVKIIDQSGQEVESLIPYFPQTEVLTPHLEFQPDQTVSIQVPWDVKQTASGNYTIRAEIIETGSINYSLPRGKIFSSAYASTFVKGVPVVGGALAINPPVLQAGARIPVILKALLRNVGNMPLDAGQYDLKIVSKNTGELYHSISVNGPALEQNQVAELDFGSWLPSDSQIGDLKVIVRHQSASSQESGASASIIDAVVAGEISGAIYIGDVATASYTLNKNALPEGNSLIQGKIELNGVDITTGSSVDPLYPVVKAALERGAEYTFKEGVIWQEKNKCLGCHIQGQAVAGLGASLGKANVEFDSARYFFNQLTTGQRPGGELETTPWVENKLSATLFGSWGLTEWPNKEKSYATLVNGLEFIWSRKRESAGNISWLPDFDTGWLNSDIAATAMAALITSRTSEFKASLNQPVLDYRWGAELLTNASRAGHNAITADSNYLYIVKDRGWTEKIDPVTKSVSILFNGVPGITALVNGVIIDADGHFLMATYTGHLFKVTQAGAVLDSYKVCENRAWGVAQSPNGSIYVSCIEDKKIVRVDQGGSITTVAEGGLLQLPHGIAWHPDGYLLIAEWSTSRIIKLDQAGDTSIFSSGFSSKPLNIVIQAKDNIFITNDTMGFNSTSSGESLGVDVIGDNGEARRVVYAADAFGITSFNGQIFASGRNRAQLAPIDAYILDDSIVDSVVGALPQMANYLLAKHDLSSERNFEHATAIIGLAEIRKRLSDEGLTSKIDARIHLIADVLRARQSIEGGWSANGFAVLNSPDRYRRPDALMTALVGLALNYTSPSASDPAVRKSIIYLLNTQKPQGYWGAVTENNETVTSLFTTHLGDTGLVMLYMPKALEIIGGLDVKLTLEQPANVGLSNASITPDATTALTNGNIQYLWDLKGVTGDGRELTFDLSVADLLLKENRPVSLNAQLQFENSFVPARTETLTASVGAPYKITSKYGHTGEGDTIQVALNQYWDMYSRYWGVAPYGALRCSYNFEPASGANSDRRVGLLRLNGDCVGGDTLYGSYVCPANAQNTGDGKCILNIPAGQFSVPIEIPLITAATEQTLDVNADKSVYRANETVQIFNLVKNLGPLFNGGTVKLAIRDNNALVSELPVLTVNALAAQENQSITTQWNTGAIAAGVYEIHAQLFDSHGHLVAEDSTAITIAATAVEGTNLVGATLSTDKLQYRLTETVKLETTTFNFANNAIQSASLGKLRIVDAQAHVVFERDIAIPQLAINGQFALPSAFTLLNVGAGNYQASWQIYNAAGTTVLASANAVFTVIEDPLQALLGTATVNQTEVDRGALQQCDFTITNRGNKTLASIAVKKSVIAVDVESVKDENVNQLSLIASGSDSSQRVFGTTTFEKGNYACVLEATVNGYSAVLATALFSVKESATTLGGDIRLGEKARLLVLMDASSTERTYLENLLTNAGWFYTIVDNAAAFTAEMNQGGYGVYALLSEKITLDQTTQASLNAKVAAGDGLLVAGATDRRHQTVEQALGIKVRANEAYAKGVAVKDSAFGLGWQRAFNKSSPVLNFTTNGATVIGDYKNDVPGADSQTLLGALGAAGRYGNFVWDNFTSLSSTVEGRLAVGGNLSLQNFSVGDKLDPTKLHDVVTVGGNVTFPSGRIYYGNLIAGGSVTGVGDAVRFGMATGAVIKGNAPMPINFTGEREYLQELSTNLAALPANGTVKMQWGGLELKGNCTSATQIFNVNGADLGVAHTFAVSCIPAGATVVFNVSGQNVAIKSMGMQSLTALRDKVLFNFPQATALSMTSVGVEGSILAPLAQVNQPAGRVDGQVIVKTWYSTTNGYMSIHNRFFGGDLSAAMGPVNKNAVSIYQHQLGKTVFAGFDVLAQAVAAGASENPFAQLLLSALEQVNPAPIVARAGKTVPVVVTYENTGGQTANGQLKLSVNGALVLINPAAFTAVANTSDWLVPLALQAGASRSQLLYVKLPQTGGGTIQLQLQTGGSPQWETRFTKTLNLQP